MNRRNAEKIVAPIFVAKTSHKVLLIVLLLRSDKPPRPVPKPRHARTTPQPRAAHQAAAPAPANFTGSRAAHEANPFFHPLIVTAVARRCAHRAPRSHVWQGRGRRDEHRSQRPEGAGVAQHHQRGHLRVGSGGSESRRFDQVRVAPPPATLDQHASPVRRQTFARTARSRVRSGSRAVAGEHSRTGPPA